MIVLYHFQMSLKIIALFLAVLVVKDCNAASNSGPSKLKRKFGENGAVRKVMNRNF